MINQNVVSRCRICNSLRLRNNSSFENTQSPSLRSLTFIVFFSFHLRLFISCFEQIIMSSAQSSKCSSNHVIWWAYKELKVYLVKMMMMIKSKAVTLISRCIHMINLQNMTSMKYENEEARNEKQCVRMS